MSIKLMEKCLTINWIHPDISQEEWDECIEQLFNSWNECEYKSSSCRIMHESAAIVANERNEHIERFARINMDSNEWDHFNDIQNKFDNVYQQWILTKSDVDQIFYQRLKDDAKYTY